MRTLLRLLPLGSLFLLGCSSGYHTEYCGCVPYKYCAPCPLPYCNYGGCETPLAAEKRVQIAGHGTSMSTNQLPNPGIVPVALPTDGIQLDGRSTTENTEE